MLGLLGCRRLGDLTEVLFTARACYYIAAHGKEELEQLTDHRELAEAFGEMMRRPDSLGNDRLNDLYHKIIALPNRTKIMRELAETLKTLIALERQAYNLDEQEHEEPYEERLRRLLGDS
jgi:hypothetical protein